MIDAPGTPYRRHTVTVVARAPAATRDVDAGPPAQGHGDEEGPRGQPSYDAPPAECRVQTPRHSNDDQ